MYGKQRDNELLDRIKNKEMMKLSTNVENNEIMKFMTPKHFLSKAHPKMVWAKDFIA